MKKPRNPIVRSLRSPIFRKRIQETKVKKAYNRKKLKKVEHD